MSKKVTNPQASQDKPVSSVPVHKAGLSRQFVPQTNSGKDLEPTEVDGDQPPANQGLLASRAEILVDQDDGGKGEAPEKEEASGEATDLASEAAVPDKFKGKTLADVIKSYTGVESLVGKKEERIKELEAKLAEAEKNPPIAVKNVQLPENIGDMFLIDPDKALAEVTKAVTSQVMAEVAKTKPASDKPNVDDTKSDADKAVAHVRAEFKDTKLSSDDLRMIDALAMAQLQGTQLERYTQAVADYKGILSYKATQTDQMKDSASLPNGGGDQRPPSGPKGKMWKRSAIDYMIVKNPELYKAKLPEIQLAIKERRIIEDAS